MGADRRTRAPSGLSLRARTAAEAAPSLSLWARYGSCAWASGRGPTTPAPRGCRPVFSLTAPAVGSSIAPLVAGLKPGAPAPVPSPPQSRRLGGSRCSGRCRLSLSQVLSGGGRASLRETARSCYAAAHSRRREVASALWADTAYCAGCARWPAAIPPGPSWLPACPPTMSAGWCAGGVCNTSVPNGLGCARRTHKGLTSRGLHRVSTRPTSGVRRPCLIRRRPPGGAGDEGVVEQIRLT